MRPERPVRFLRIMIEGEEPITQSTEDMPIDDVVEHTKQRASGRYWCIKLMAGIEPDTGGE